MIKQNTRQGKSPYTKAGQENATGEKVSRPDKGVLFEFFPLLRWGILYNLQSSWSQQQGSIINIFGCKYFLNWKFVNVLNFHHQRLVGIISWAIVWLAEYGCFGGHVMSPPMRLVHWVEPWRHCKMLALASTCWTLKLEHLVLDGRKTMKTWAIKKGN